MVWASGTAPWRPRRCRRASRSVPVARSWPVELRRRRCGTERRQSVLAPGRLSGASIAGGGPRVAGAGRSSGRDRVRGRRLDEPDVVVSSARPHGAQRARDDVDRWGRTVAPHSRRVGQRVLVVSLSNSSGWTSMLGRRRCLWPEAGTARVGGHQRTGCHAMAQPVALTKRYAPLTGRASSLP